MNWDKVSKNKEVVDLLKLREKIEEKIRELDSPALMNYEYEQAFNTEL